MRVDSSKCKRNVTAYNTQSVNSLATFWYVKSLHQLCFFNSNPGYCGV